MLLWASISALALIVHFWLTRAVAVAVVYGAASLFLLIALDRHARRRLGRAAGITGRGRYDGLKFAAIEFAVDGLPLPASAEREYLHARRVCGIVFYGTFVVVVVLLVDLYGIAS